MTEPGTASELSAMLAGARERLTMTQHSAYIVVPQELIDDALPPWGEIERRIEENTRAFAALPLEEQARIMAERKATYEAERCTRCGCHPDEHAS